MLPKKLSLSDISEMLMSGLDTFFREVSAHTLLIVATKGSSGGKKSKNSAFLGCFSKVKSEECNQQNWSVSIRFGIIIPCSATYILEVAALVSLKVASKVFLELKKTVKFYILD